MHRNVYSDWSKDLFADAAVVENPTTFIYLAGIAAEGPDGEVQYPGDLTRQVDTAYAKIRAILEAQGATFADVVRIQTYLLDVAALDEYQTAQKRALGDVPPPPHSLIGVSALAKPDMLVEVEVTAVL